MSEDNKDYEPKRLTEAEINELAGLAAGIVADGVVNQDEAEFLREWFLKHEDAANSDSRVKHIFECLEWALSDGKLDDDEARVIFDYLRGFSDADVDYEGDESPEAKNEIGTQDLRGEIIDLMAEIARLKKENTLEVKEKDEANARAIKISDKLEQLIMKKDELQDKLSAAEMRASEAEASLREKEQDGTGEIKITKEIEQELYNGTRDVKIGAHPARELSLRAGIKFWNGKHTIALKFIVKEGERKYVVQLPQFEDKEVVAVIGMRKDKRLFVKSIRNRDTSFSKKFEEIVGRPDSDFKDRSDLTSDQFVAIHDYVMNGAERPEFLDS